MLSRYCQQSRLYVGMEIEMLKNGERYIPTIAASLVAIVAMLSNASADIQQGSLLVVGVIAFFTVVGNL